MRYLVFLIPLCIVGCSCYSFTHYQTELLNKDSVDQDIEACRKDSPTTLKTQTIAAGKSATIEWDKQKLYNRADLES